jgi:Xaa-Pro aminopeptidase
MKNRWPVFLFLLLALQSSAQWDDTDRLSPLFHKAKRDSLRALMPEKSAAVFFAAPVRNRSNDVDFQFSQQPDFYYLSGHIEPNAVMVLFKESRLIDGAMHNELLFVQKRNPLRELWTGRVLGADGARGKLGFKAAYTGNDWIGFGINWSAFNEVLVQWPDQPNTSREDDADLGDLVDELKLKLKQVGITENTRGIRSIMASLREVKTSEELYLIQRAVDITIEGFLEMMRELKPGMKEYEAQAWIEFHARKNGSEYMGYPSICGGGDNACVLHYTHNRKPLLDGELLLVDMGAEYHGYTADITRTVPVNGAFTDPQRKLYELVWKAQQAGIKVCRKGASFRSAHEEARKVIGEGLVELGVISKKGEADLYFMHGTSHYLGLDVHDAGTYEPLKPGVVMTVEPGIYIPEGSPCDPKWWKTGIRIEDDILVTDGDPVVLSQSLPSRVEEIEAVMRGDYGTSGSPDSGR